MGVMFSTQEYLSNTITNWGIHHFNGGEIQHQFWKQTGGFVGGGIAGIVSKTVVMPFDVIRKRLQVQGPSRHRYVFTKIPFYPSTMTFIGTTLHIVKREGILGLYKGLLPALLKSGPSSAVIFLVVGNMTTFWDKFNNKKH